MEMEMDVNVNIDIDIDIDIESKRSGKHSHIQCSSPTQEVTPQIPNYCKPSTSPTHCLRAPLSTPGNSLTSFTMM